MIVWNSEILLDLFAKILFKWLHPVPGKTIPPLYLSFWCVILATGSIVWKNYTAIILVFQCFMLTTWSTGWNKLHCHYNLCTKVLYTCDWKYNLPLFWHEKGNSFEDVYVGHFLSSLDIRPAWCNSNYDSMHNHWLPFSHVNT